jgi:hypothetical protein
MTTLFAATTRALAVPELVLEVASHLARADLAAASCASRA